MVTILGGENRELMDFQLQKQIRSLNLPVLTFDYQKDPAEAIEAELNSFSLFDDERIIVVDGASFLQPSRKKTVIPAMFLDVQPSIHLFLLWDGKISSRKDAFLFADAIIPCDMLDDKNKKELLSQLLEGKGISLHPRDVSWLSQRLDDNPFIMDSELEKVALLDKPDRKSIEQILIPSRENDVFALSRAFYQRDLEGFLSLFRKFIFQNNMEPLAIIALLSSQIRFLFQVLVLNRTKSQEEIASYLEAKKGRIYYALKDARRFRPDQLLSSLSLLSRIEQQIKTGALSGQDALEARIIELFANNR